MKIDNYWPLVVVTPPKENTLQRESTAHLPLEVPKDQVVRVNRTELQSHNSWEKGTFIDIYV